MASLLCPLPSSSCACRTYFWYCKMRETVSRWYSFCKGRSALCGYCMWKKMGFVSRQLVFKFACVVIASIVTFAGVLMSMDLLRQMPSRSSSSSNTLHLLYQLELKDQNCIDCTFYLYSRAYLPNLWYAPLVEICVLWLVQDCFKSMLFREDSQLNGVVAKKQRFIR